MSLWEYKVITSGKGGFATPALLEKFLNDLGRDEWEIIHYANQPDNPLSFTGLARRSTQRDWTLQDAAAAAAKAEAEKLRAEFEAKFKAATSNGPAATAEEKAPSFLEEQVAPEDGFRKPVDTSRDSEPDAPEDEETDDWDKLAEEDELPTFFDALKPHMRRNQRGPGMSVGTDYLAKKWGLAEEDVKGALVECGLQIPADENAKPVYVEYDGDLFWVNINRRGELWINTREKPRPVFRVVQGTKVAAEEETKPENGNRNADAGDRKTEPAERKEDGEGGAQKREAQPAEKAPLPAGPELLEKIRKHMRRNRRGPGGSGSTSFLARALRTTEADLMAAFATLGLTLPEKSGDKPQFTEIGAELWWLNRDQRGGVWINGREKKDGETLPEAGDRKAEGEAAPVAVEPATGAVETAAATETAAPAAAEPKADAVLAGVRLLLKEGKGGTFAGETEKLAAELGKPAEDFIATLVAVGLKVPEKAREKPVFVEHAGEIFWFNRNARGQLWLNAKASKFAAKDDAAAPEGDEKPKRSRSRKKE